MTQQQRDNRKDPHITFTKRSFAGGEYSPQIVQARSDLDLYQRGLVQCLNCIPLPDGSLVQRPPTRFYDSSQIPLRASRLLAFPLEIDQTVLFIFGDKQMACFTVFETDSPKFFSLWDTPYTRREAKYLDYARMGSWIILTHPSHPPHKIEIMGEDSVHFGVQEFNPPPWLGEREVNGQISNAKLQIKLTPSRKGSVYVKASEPVFKRSDVGRTLRLGYRFRFWQPKTLYPEGSYVSMYGKVYVCVHEGISGDTWVDNQRDVLLKDGQVSWKLQFNDQVLSVGKDGKSTLGTGSQARRPYYVWGRITAVRGATHATLELHKKFGVTDDSLTSDWNFGAWGREEGYPSHVRFYHNRLCFSGSKFDPQVIYLSSYNIFNDFTPERDDGSPDYKKALSLTITDTTMTGIRWFRPMERGIIIGTDTSLWIASISLEKGFDPTVRRLASLGVYNAFPLSVSDGLVFVQGAGRKIQAVSGAREQGFNFVDLTRYVDHLFDYRISQMAYQEDPYSILWVVTGDGKLCGCTLTTQSEGGAWHTHKIGGRGVKVVSMSTCVCVDQGETTLWLLVSRINEQGVRGVGLEKLSAFQPSDDHGDGLFLKGE